MFKNIKAYDTSILRFNSKTTYHSTEHYAIVNSNIFEDIEINLSDTYTTSEWTYLIFIEYV